MCDASVEQQTFTDLINIHRYNTERTMEDEVKVIKIFMDKLATRIRLIDI